MASFAEIPLAGLLLCLLLCLTIVGVLLDDREEMDRKLEEENPLCEK